MRFLTQELIDRRRPATEAYDEAVYLSLSVVQGGICSRLTTSPQLPVSRKEFLQKDRTDFTILRDYGGTPEGWGVGMSEIVRAVEWVDDDGHHIEVAKRWRKLDWLVTKAFDASRRGQQDTRVYVHLGIDHKKLAKAVEEGSHSVHTALNGDFMVQYVPPEFDQQLDATRYPFHISPAEIHHALVRTYHPVSDDKTNKPAIMWATTASGIRIDVTGLCDDLAAIQLKKSTERFVVPLATLIS